MTSRSNRANARREVLRAVADLKRKLALLQGWWDVRGVVYLKTEERGPDGSWHRDRRPEEYPEAQRRYWASTIAEVDKMQAALTALREHCTREYHLSDPDRSTPAG